MSPRPPILTRRQRFLETPELKTSPRSTARCRTTRWFPVTRRLRPRRLFATMRESLTTRSSERAPPLRTALASWNMRTLTEGLRISNYAVCKGNAEVGGPVHGSAIIDGNYIKNGDREKGYWFLWSWSDSKQFGEVDEEFNQLYLEYQFEKQDGYRVWDTHGAPGQDSSTARPTSRTTKEPSSNSTARMISSLFTRASHSLSRSPLISTLNGMVGRRIRP